jgi:4'-phosphopantetheinyl transferase
MKASRADIWILPTATASADLIAAVRPLLSEDELARAARFHVERHAHNYVLSHALVRTVLSRYAPVAPAAWTFTVNEHGRPSVGDARFASLRFNLSHTDGCAAVGVASGRDVGIDVEAMARPRVGADVARRFFAPAEVAALRRVPDPGWHRAFLEIWTLKEAYIKARGVGIGLGLMTFACTRGDGGPPSLVCGPELGDDGSTWHMEQFTPTPAHVGAIAVRRDAGAAVDVRLHRLTPEDLLA